MGKKRKKQKKGKSKIDDYAVRSGPEDDVADGHHLWQTIEPVWRWANNPLVADVLAAALVAGAHAVSKSRPAQGAARSAAAGAGEMAETASEGVSSLRHAIAVAVGEVASAIVHAYEQEVGGKTAPGRERPASPRRIR